MTEKDLKEKLVELLCKMISPTITIGEQADFLIANGVTFAEDNNVPSKWISVNDRLPEDDSDVLAFLRIGEEGRIYPANYAKGMWFDYIFNTPATDTTTHWMPLPPAPKGE